MTRSMNKFSLWRIQSFWALVGLVSGLGAILLATSAVAQAAGPTIKITTPTPANAVVAVPDQMEILNLRPPNTLEGKTQRKKLGLPNDEGLKPNSPNFDVYLASAEGREWMHYRTVYVTVVSHSMSDAHVSIKLTYKIGKQMYGLRVLRASPSNIRTSAHDLNWVTIKSALLGASTRTAAITTVTGDACIVVKTTITLDRTKESATEEDQICWGK